MEHFLRAFSCGEVLGGERGSWSVLQNIVKNEGAHALFRGTGARVLWLVPGGGITLCVFEAVMGAVAL